MRANRAAGLKQFGAFDMRQLRDQCLAHAGPLRGVVAMHDLGAPALPAINAAQDAGDEARGEIRTVAGHASHVHAPVAAANARHRHEAEPARDRQGPGGNAPATHRRSQIAHIGPGAGVLTQRLDFTHDGRCIESGHGALGSVHGKQALAPGDIRGIDHAHLPAERSTGRFGGLQGAGDGAGEADVDHFLVVAEEKTEHAPEIPDRRLRGAHRLRALAQHRVEGIGGQ